MNINQATGLSQEIDALVDDMFEYHKWTPEQVQQGQGVRSEIGRAHV